jgi:hypothetical protein
MRFGPVRNCCTARNLCELPYDCCGPWCKTLDKNQLIKKLNKWKDDGVVIVHCYLNSKQMETLEALKKIGFKCSRPVTKTIRETSTDLYLLYICLDTFNKGK